MPAGNKPIRLDESGRKSKSSVTRSRDFARKWGFLEAARALKIGPRALCEF